VQLAETVRQYQVARAQINARLQRGGASSEEKQHVRALLGEAYRGIEESFREEELAQEDLLKCESAVQGLRKNLLPREWNDRCLTCGTRHSDVERGTCKFWVAWSEKRKKRLEAEEKEVQGVTPPATKNGAGTGWPAVPGAETVEAAVEAPLPEAPTEPDDDDKFVPFLPSLKSKA